ncbi:MAG: hypothetical protein ACI85O_002598 [Saprospiraceae bacterium]|jgi:hypothetical protein
MAISKNDIDLIDKFLRNGLSQTELALFSERMEKEEFKEEVAFKQDVKKAVKQVGRRDMKAELQQLEKSNKPKKEARTVSFKPWLLAAASVLLLILTFFWFNSQKPTSSELFAEYYVPYPNVITEPIVKGKSANDDLSRALQQYELKNYEAAKTLFDQLPDTDSLLFYHGVTAIGLNDFALAKTLFEEVLTTENSSFKTPSLYYLGLNSLQLDDMKAAQNYFTEVTQVTDNPKLVKQAEEILRKLK